MTESRLTSRRLLEVEDQLTKLWRHVSKIPVRFSRPQQAASGAVGSWIGFITASALQSGFEARWNYTVQKASFTSAGWAIITGNNAKSVTATNRRELAHIVEPGAGTAWYIWGVDVHGDDYPATFDVRPVGGGGTTGTHKNDVLVTVYEMIDEAGTITYEFDSMGSHDGTCD